jgi:hypothetical protein
MDFLANSNLVIMINSKHFTIRSLQLLFFFALPPTAYEYQLAFIFLALLEVFFISLAPIEASLLFPSKPRQLFILLPIFFSKPLPLLLF